MINFARVYIQSEQPKAPIPVAGLGGAQEKAFPQLLVKMSPVLPV